MNKQEHLEVLGDVLAGRRLSVGLTQLEVARRLSKPQSFISKYESAQRRLDLIEVEDIAIALESFLEAVILD